MTIEKPRKLHWEIWNRVMVVIGTAATVGALAVGVYSIIVPGTLTSLLEQILARVQAEPTIADRDRFGVASLYCYPEGECHVGIGKLQTSAPATVGVEVCTLAGVKHDSRKTFGLHVTESYLDTKVLYPASETDVDLRLIVDHGGDIFTVFTPLKADGGIGSAIKFNPSSISRTETGDHGCLPV